MDSSKADINNKPNWEAILGAGDEFSIENRMFNYVCVVLAIPLLVFLLCDFILFRQVNLGILCIVLLVALGSVYYFSRVKKSNHYGIAIIAIFSYSGLIMEFLYSGGVNGSALYTFFLTFVILVTLDRIGNLLMWTILHLAVAAALLTYQYLFPEKIVQYDSFSMRVADTAITFETIILIVFLVVRFLRQQYYIEKNKAEERAVSIHLQNLEIVAQNAKLERMNQEKNKMFSIISHDLSAPMVSILGYLELLNEDFGTEGEKNNILAELRSQTQYTAQLLQNMLTWAKSQMHGVQLHVSDIDLQHVLDDTKHYVAPFAAKKNITTNFAPVSNMRVHADKELMFIVLRNIANNAVKFTQAGGAISVSVTEKDGNAIVAIKDTGMGIPKEKQSAIFSLKMQSSYGTDNEKGIGLGLILCKEYVELQKGAIWFESVPNEGTTFFVSVPLASAA
jgi:two-component system, sensor histidine kinase and response regulator